MRRDWDEYFMELAEKARTRATCPRRQVGCVIVQNKRVKATGYNGSPPGQPHCTDVGCHMVSGICKRTIHAEANALDVSLSARASASLYCTDFPCPDCAERITHSGIVEVVYLRPYHTGMEQTTELFHDCGITVRQLGV